MLVERIMAQLVTVQEELAALRTEVSAVHERITDLESKPVTTSAPATSPATRSTTAATPTVAKPR